MKDLIFGDVHIHTYTMYAHTHAEYGSNRIARIIESLMWIRDLAQSTNPDRIVFLGDLVEDKNIVRFESYTRAVRVFYQIADIAPVYAIVGNHDITDTCSICMDTEWYPQSALTPLEGHPNIHVISKICRGDDNTVFMPYTKHLPDGFNELEYDTLYTHIGISEIKMGASNLGRISCKEFVGGKQVFSGHFHIPTVIGQFVYVGALLPASHKSDSSKEYGCIIKDGNFKRITNPYAWKFYTFFHKKGEKIPVYENAYVRILSEDVKNATVQIQCMDTNALYKVQSIKNRDLETPFQENGDEDLELKYAKKWLMCNYPTKCDRLVTLLDKILRSKR